MATVCFACANDLAPDADTMRCCYCEEFFTIPASLFLTMSRRASSYGLMFTGAVRAAPRPLPTQGARR
ncbi:exocyst complex component 2 [Anopheles sinensis]|uniref:Exocyst complex component 2 n=1 Tax=Anopheles sinensis TaxID=74873 RepID=A0A084VBE4_ANOSI|nr:exocyst complex component 2 [Anopheles sinensis]